MNDKEVENGTSEVDAEEIDDETLDAESHIVKKILEGVKKSSEIFERHSRVDPDYWDELKAKMLETTSPEQDKFHEGIKESFEAIERASAADQFIDENYEALLAIPQMKQVKQEFITEQPLLEDKLDKLAKMMFGKFIEEIGGRLEPVEPSAKAPLDEWFDWYHLRKRMKFSVTLKDVADKSHRTHQHVKNQHLIYKAGREEL